MKNIFDDLSNRQIVFYICRMIFATNNNWWWHNNIFRWEELAV